MVKNISNLGDAAVYCDFGSEVNEKINANVIDYFHHISKLIKDKKIEGIINLTPSYNKLIINFDLSITNYKKIKNFIEGLTISRDIKDNNQKIRIPVCCDDEYGLDFLRLTKKLNIDKDKILELYFGKEYFCYMTGFIAGMPFLGDINKGIRCDRLETPRVKVPKGSVAITEQFTNIYTFESPGGWNIIGNTPKKVFDKSNLLDPTLIKPGNKVIFYQISKEEYLDWNE
ncbi:allophanate hydrolase subunit 1 [Candidatus Pelagibacter bacterium]|jgi:KipI family sensor histidine kinase inhibitor|uniref:Allophanate hydrolase subunit 1 n=1 Tax=Pelagibacter ubique (strain HTCC1002) TaxID=314261 RepID=Q1V267_PELU1|nr:MULTISPECIES: allophanate hydrolase subunit 1 [Pelagibacter]MBT7010195.1 allophanate hydrolase subunit 1 [Flavobacteriaceae bacterium]MDA7443842.1 allophanate hydrolase subunit 1 [Candidatus Pelagibacter ubique]MDC0598039.1 allophanate hydrolase subunit 1 [bacterium]EAS84661.1 Allophanate hydrolase subunit 1 [Candidatus Pelagibacter ubique HTCC1002]MDA7453103.1 allophanate hydrolase subunit 1 [Candidatus Pelagibacter ubique]